MNNIQDALYLAQFNIAQARGTIDSAIMKEFREFIDPINSLAEDAPGFVWRAIDQEGRSSSYLEVPELGANMLVNLSVWKDIESLKSFTYKTVHSYFVKHRSNWFEKLDSHHLVMWWIDSSYRPTIEEGLSKLEYLKVNGPSYEAFTFPHIFHSGQP